MCSDWLLCCREVISGKTTWSLSSLVFCALLLFLPYHVTGVRVINGAVTATVGEDTNLTCKLIDTRESLSQISWQRKLGASSEPENFLTFDPDTGPNAVGIFGKRVKFIGNASQMEGSISIPNPSISDEGIYICIFTLFPSGPYKHNIMLTVNACPVVTVTTEDPPEVGCEERTVATCTAANGKPAADVFWEYGEDLKIPFTAVMNRTVNENNTITVRSELRAIPSRSMQQKEVRCIVKHPLLTQHKNISHRLSVHYPPQWVNIAKVKDSSLDTVFICEAEANPQPTDYHWYRINHTLTSSKIRANGRRLELLEQSPDVNGLYVIEASNTYGKASGTIYIYIGTTSRSSSGMIAAFALVAAVLFVLFLNIMRATEMSRCRPSSSNSRDQPNDNAPDASTPLAVLSASQEMQPLEGGSSGSAGQIQE
ncbi:nectin-1 [Amia ocellicauda]|uniref:nectin-1 n=1 Tax=Amia ocellicauda TaxID=2972642 RepID=UPI0034643E7D